MDSDLVPFLGDMSRIEKKLWDWATFSLFNQNLFQIAFFFSFKMLDYYIWTLLCFSGKDVQEKENLKEMGDVSSGMASTVIQVYLKAILESFLHPKPECRLASLKVISIILSQGLVHPAQIVPYLICMATDSQTRISHAADRDLQVSLFLFLSQLGLFSDHLSTVQSLCLLLQFFVRKVLKTNVK